MSSLQAMTSVNCKGPTDVIPPRDDIRKIARNQTDVIAPSDDIRPKECLFHNTKKRLKCILYNTIYVPLRINK